MEKLESMWQCKYLKSIFSQFTHSSSCSLMVLRQGDSVRLSRGTTNWSCSSEGELCGIQLHISAMLNVLHQPACGSNFLTCDIETSFFLVGLTSFHILETKKFRKRNTWHHIHITTAHHGRLAKIQTSTVAILMAISFPMIRYYTHTAAPLFNHLGCAQHRGISTPVLSLTIVLPQWITRIVLLNAFCSHYMQLKSISHAQIGWHW